MKLLAALAIGALSWQANAQQAPKSLGEPLDTYVSELVSYQYGAAPYCMVDGSDRFLKQVERRLHRITAKLVAQVGQEPVAHAKAQAITQFDQESASVDFAACKLSDPAFDKQKLRALRETHLPNLKSLERQTKIANKKLRA